ncbi:MAG: Type I phosphodiesterase / nucleotide pyrophosphatase [Methanocella sp. PtaU1.Bin125]|nr:MAG: Type I phosphodiesterase / nucleotide pyrophosphatase [Methanocella sp. PtaU1.Bin125]
MMSSMRISPAAVAVFLSLLAVAVGGCINSAGAWTITINGNPQYVIDRTVYDGFGYRLTINGTTGVPLEQFLYAEGLYPVTEVTIAGRSYDWNALANATTFELPLLVTADGRVFDGQGYLRAGNINVTVADRPAHTSLDIAPSMLYALGLGGDDTLIQGRSDRVVLFYVDAMGYERYEQAKSRGIINNITSLGAPEKLACMYPSVSIVNGKTLITGMPPDAGKGDYESHLPDGPTVLETAAQHGLIAYWIGGNTSPVDPGDFRISCPDRNENGYEADEVTTEAIRQYGSGADLLYVHYKDSDTIAHVYGPFSDEAMASLEYADIQIGRMLPCLDPGTIVIVYADHGGHKVPGGGNHGCLIPSDMIVPFIVHVI